MALVVRSDWVRDGSVLAPFAPAWRRTRQWGGSAPAPMARDPRALRRRRPHLRARRGAAVHAFAAAAGSPRGRGSGAFAAAMPRCAPHGVRRLAERRAGRFRCGLAPGSRLDRSLWSGNRTRDTRLKRPMLYPTELSSGGRTGFEPAANGMHRCSPSELSSARGAPPRVPRHAPRQRRAHRTGATFKPRTRAAVERLSMLRIGASSKAPIRVRSHPPPPVPKHPGTAREAPPAVFPCLGRRPSGCFGVRDAIAFDSLIDPLRTPKTKHPRVATRGRSRLPREIGVTDLRRRDQSSGMKPVRAPSPRGRPHVAGPWSRGRSAVWLAMQVDGFMESGGSGNAPCRRRPRTLRARISRCKWHSDERSFFAAAAHA